MLLCQVMLHKGPANLTGTLLVAVVEKQLGSSTNQRTALHKESVSKMVGIQAQRLVTAAQFMQKVLVVGSACPISPSSPDVPPDIQAESTSRRAAGLHAEDQIEASFVTQ